ncbi:MAG: hypothetical protein LBF71_01330 [Campylobacteraceae bacterium]|jgi:hypothetical protein|nr:hypothetical protein [Campylobacteraceae bacterium]
MPRVVLVWKAACFFEMTEKAHVGFTDLKSLQNKTTTCEGIKRQIAPLQLLFCMWIASPIKSARNDGRGGFYLLALHVGCRAYARNDKKALPL